MYYDCRFYWYLYIHLDAHFEKKANELLWDDEFGTGGSPNLGALFIYALRNVYSCASN